MDELKLISCFDSKVFIKKKNFILNETTFDIIPCIQYSWCHGKWKLIFFQSNQRFFSFFLILFVYLHPLSGYIFFLCFIIKFQFFLLPFFPNMISSSSSQWINLIHLSQGDTNHYMTNGLLMMRMMTKTTIYLLLLLFTTTTTTTRERE